MAVTTNGALYFESGGTFYDFEEMTNTSGDQKTFEASFTPGPVGPPTESTMLQLSAPTDS